MNFPWYKYTELPTSRRNTLQVFIANKCLLKCPGCFARNIMQGGDDFIPIDEYSDVIENALSRGVEKVNLLGGEPTLHPNLLRIIEINTQHKLRTTIYSNGGYLDQWNKDYLFSCFEGLHTKLRMSVYSRTGPIKSLRDYYRFKNWALPIEFCFMVSSSTTADELLCTALEIEQSFDCGVFFISSIRELDNPRQEFFDDTKLSMPVMKYKELVHEFLNRYNGNMEIHVSKRGVFESTTTLAENKCRFSNYFIGGKIIQCPYDAINLKYQEDYEFGKRCCVHNNTCLMSKVIYQRKI